MTINKEKGFTLIEIAIVMVIIGILVGSSIPIMRVLHERKLREQNLEYLQQAKEAIINFAIINGRLPLEDITIPAIPPVPPDGHEDAGSAGNPNGNLPYLDLNLPATDPYGRVLKYIVNGGLTINRQTTCNTLLTGLAGNPLAVDAGGAVTAFPVAAVLISNGPTTPFNLVVGAFSGNNATGSPNYIKSFLTNSFDDEAVYIGGFELYGKVCGNFTTASINNTSAAPVYVRKIGPGTPANVGMLSAGSIATYTFTPGTQIGIYNNLSGTPPTVGSNPATPVIAAGEGLVITIP